MDEGMVLSMVIFGLFIYVLVLNAVGFLLGVWLFLVWLLTFAEVLSHGSVT